ncbi:hypothetical protein C8Q77DRAFT_1157201 [Trametes polyzona]|nr:hypothetical protein C8Q77DRAFT_1157201 [Trametes polyzona]
MATGGFTQPFCKLIIDACAEDYFLRDRYRTLKSTALTCRVWREHSQIALLRDVRFRTLFGISRFVEELAKHPEWGPLVYSLHITPARMHTHGYMPLVSLLLKLRNLRDIRLGQLNWSIYPFTLTQQMSLITTSTLTSLDISNMLFPGVTDLIRLIWALPQLTNLLCGLMRFDRRLDPDDLQKLVNKTISKKHTWLKVLALWEMDGFPPVLETFGDAVVHLDLRYPESSWPWENLCKCITSYANLQHVTLALWVGVAGVYPNPRTPYPFGTEPLAECTYRFRDLLRHINSRRMRSITLRLAPCMLETEDGLYSFTYRSSRLDAIDALFGRIDEDVLSSKGRLRDLQTISLHVYENSTYYDAHWWCHVLRTRLGTIPKQIDVYVDYYDPTLRRGRYDFVDLWLLQQNQQSSGAPLVESHPPVRQRSLTI